MADRWESAKLIYGEDVFDKIKTSKILVIGAGGIGCELLKNLVLTGFHQIEVVDLDTIDVSNLNRQFLFHKQHVGHSKAKVARESVQRFNPDANIVAHHADVKSPEFGATYVKQFALVLNALDNLSARRHVNRVCLAADVPLIESGTAGWLGQVQPIIPKVTACFECEPKPAPKVYPVCTIRSSPAKPIHCIVWGKMLFGRLFGKSDDSNAVTDLDDDGGAATDAEADGEPEAIDAELHKAYEADKQYLKSIKATIDNSSEDFIRFVFHKIFHTDVLSLASMKHMWKDKKTPRPMILNEVLEGTFFDDGNREVTEGLLEDQKVWTLQECAQKFLSTALALRNSINEDSPPLSWDKDEDLHLDFVVAAANLRAGQFDIPRQSKWTVKSEAGNIIPAIATTNAVVGGMIVTEAIKVLAGKSSDLKQTFVYKQPQRKMYLLATEVDQKNPNCYVCSETYISLKVDTEKTSLRFFIDEILIKALNFTQPSVMVGDNIVYESGEDAEMFEGMLDKSLSSVGIRDNIPVRVEDFAIEDFDLEISIVHTPQHSFPEPDTMLFEITGSVTKPTAAPAANPAPAAVAPASSGVQEIEEDDLFIMDIAPDANGSSVDRGKRKRESPANEGGAKKSKSDEDLMEIIE